MAYEKRSKEDWETGRILKKAFRTKQPYTKHRMTKPWAELKVEVLTGYGGSCKCCGEAEQAFLAIDHIDGMTEAEKKYSAGKLTGTKLYIWLATQRFLKGYRILCHNCNTATRRGKVCPHQL